MPAQHFVPTFANALHLSPRVQANALRALALDQDAVSEREWASHAAAALLVGAEWAGEACDRPEVARAARVSEAEVAQQYARLAQRLKDAQRHVDP